jgi:hypothetical protein
MLFLLLQNLLELPNSGFVLHALSALFVDLLLEEIDLIVSELMFLVRLIKEVNFLVEDLLHLSNGGLISHTLPSFLLDLGLKQSYLIASILGLVFNNPLKSLDCGLVGQALSPFLV